MVGNNLKDTQLQQIVDKTILFADKDEDGKISFEEFCAVSPSSVFFKIQFRALPRKKEKPFPNESNLLDSGGWQHRRAQKDGR